MSPAAHRPPIIVSAASVPSTAINALTTPLSVLGADDGGEANLTYTWSIYGDAPGPVAFSDNNDNTAKAVTATFTTSGTYRLQAVATDADGLSSDASMVTVVVTLAEAKPIVTISVDRPSIPGKTRPARFSPSRERAGITC